MKFKVIGKHVTSSGKYLDGIYEDGSKVIARDYGHAEIGDTEEHIWQGDRSQFYKIYNNGIYKGKTNPYGITNYLVK